MSLLKKTVVLINNGAEGYVTVVCVGEEAGAKIVGTSFTQSMRAGLRVGNNPTVFLPLEGEKTEVTLPHSVDQNDDVSCVVINGENIVASAGKRIRPEEVFEHFSTHKPVSNPPPTTKIAKPTLSKPTEKATQQKKTVESPLPKNDEKPRASNGISQEADFLEKLKSTNTKNFYYSVKKKIDELFVVHPQEKKLEEIIPQSKWVKINYDGSDYYVVGVLNEEEQARYLAYGVPGKKNIAPPQLADNICDWLPVDGLDGYDGYWLIFQDADTGNISNIN